MRTSPRGRCLPMHRTVLGHLSSMAQGLLADFPAWQFGPRQPMLRAVVLGRDAMRSLIMLLVAATAAGPALAQNSHCAGLPATAQVEVAGPDNVIPAQLTPRGFSCPRGFTAETVGPVTRCRQPGQIRLENREPRKLCYAALGLSAPRSVPVQNRPVAACPGVPSIDNVIALRGSNIGWQDIAVTAPQGSGVTVEQLRTVGGRTPAAEDPVRQDCFAFNCRLVRLTARPNAPASVPITISAPGNAATASVTVALEATCPAR